MEGKYVVYYRVSTKKQGESGLGLEAQRTYVQHFYADKNIIAEFTENVSGKNISNRPELIKALEICKKQRATLVVAKIDRLSRRTEQALWIYSELEGRLESCDIPNLEKFTLTLFMAIADRERELISLRTKAALDEKKKKQGEWRKPSIKFQLGVASKEGTRALQEDAKANENNKRASSIIKELKEKLIPKINRKGEEVGKRPMSWTEIANKLNDDGFKTSKGSKFQAVQVQRIYERPKD